MTQIGLSYLTHASLK